MRIFKWKRLAPVILVGLCCASAVRALAFADDDGKDKAPDKSDHDLFDVTIGGGKINNPGRYLVLLPPINGATAASGTPYFTENPGDPFKAWDMSGTFDYMPSQYITFRWEYNYRVANVPYFSGPGGVTPPGGNQGAPGSLVTGFTPDLRKNENRLIMAILVKF
jgi:hypothetical protein